MTAAGNRVYRPAAKAAADTRYARFSPPSRGSAFQRTSWFSNMA